MSASANQYLSLLEARALPAAWLAILTETKNVEDREDLARRKSDAGTAEEEREDIRASLGGDGSAYARIIRRHQQTLARRMVRFTRDPRLIEELVHDVFVEAYFSLKNFRGDAPLEHWLTRIATRVGYHHWTRRKQDRDRATTLASLAPTSPNASDRATEKSDAAALLAAVLEELPPRDRLVVTLLYLEERSVAEAAELAGWSQVMVKVQAFRARGKLRKLLEKHAWVADYWDGEKS